MQPVDAEAARGAAQAVAHQPAKGSHLRDGVALDHVAEEHRVLAAMAQELPQAERTDHRRHPTAAERRVDLAREHPCRGTRDHDLAALGVEHPPDEALPLGPELDLVQESVQGHAPAEPRVAAVVLLKQGAELIALEAGKSVVVEADVKRPLGRQDRTPLLQELEQDRCLAGPAHPDHRPRLAGHRREPRIPARKARLRGFEGGVELLDKDRVERHGSRIERW